KVLNSQLFEYQSGAFLTSTINQLTVSVLSNFEVPMPPASERSSIAEFLDRETGKIDALMKKKERLIELLREKRTALISHAVTQGLNPTAPKKDSGIPWLGHIPKHWEVSLLKRFARVRYGLGQPPPELFEGPPLIRATNIDSGKITEVNMLR